MLGSLQHPRLFLRCPLSKNSRNEEAWLEDSITVGSDLTLQSAPLMETLNIRKILKRHAEGFNQTKLGLDLRAKPAPSHLFIYLFVTFF